MKLHSLIKLPPGIDTDHVGFLHTLPSLISSDRVHILAWVAVIVGVLVVLINRRNCEPEMLFDYFDALEQVLWEGKVVLGLWLWLWVRMWLLLGLEAMVVVGLWVMVIILLVKGLPVGVVVVPGVADS